MINMVFIHSRGCAFDNAAGRQFLCWGPPKSVLIRTGNQSERTSAPEVSARGACGPLRSCRAAAEANPPRASGQEGRHGRDEPEPENTYRPPGGADGNHPEHPAAVTSNKARAERGLPLLKDEDGVALRHDALRPQRLAAPAKVYVEQFSAHPLESDVAELYGPPDGYIGSDGVFRKQRQNANDKAVYEIELKPEDGLYPLPYMATQADGTAWEEECTSPGAPNGRQGFFPDGSRSFEEIDRMSIGVEGAASSAVFHCNDRFLSGRAAGRLHRGSAGASAQR